MGSALVLWAGACSDSDTAGGGPEGGDRAISSSSGQGQSGAGGAPTAYVLLDQPGWQLNEAIDYRAGVGPLGELEPDLDWYAEYEGPQVDHDDGSFTVPATTISGHFAGLDERRGQLPGFRLVGEEVAGRRALLGSGPGGSPQVAIVELRPDYSVTLVTYDEVVDVRELASRLVAADEGQWLAAGGSMLDCVPLEPGCAPDG